MLKGAIKCPDCEGSSMNKLTCRASSKHGGGTYTYYRCTGTGSRRKGCGNMVRMEVVDAAVNEIMATTFRVPVKRLIMVKGTDYQDQLDEISYRIRALDPDVMSDEQFDEQVRRLRAERDRLKALPAEPDRWDEQLTGELYADIYRALPVPERGAWLTSHGFVIHATKKQVSVIQGDVRGTAHLGQAVNPVILLAGLQCRLPHPFSPADRAAGYRYDISILQAEFSLTQMLDKPVSGRIFFEQVIRDNLGLGRPDRISLIFGRSIYRGRKNRTPGTFATRVVTDGVTPSLHVLYKHAQIKITTNSARPCGPRPPSTRH